MKRFLFFLTLVAFLFISPLHYYAEYHLKNFSDGIFFHFLRIAYTPEDYNDDLLEIFISDHDEISVQLNHKYRGSYKILMYGEHVKNKELDFDITLECQDSKLRFTQSQQKHTDLFRVNSSNMIIGWYDVTSDMPLVAKCLIKAELGGSPTPVFLKILIANHL
ncbi:hypothetical protein [Alishewanella jeotgali]|uniref:Uncharacterized protein n=1 Tax=Alishewanella jeotgali KCTC 22429 TaxID=1129374 RepID=H3ZDZ2_9ALTE|nr:hypothetical protein [Alishewanella jeotgali]EHR41169.1 hypothetical protein AJE_07870 [Alishewanella jeotgali KCTC 22429]